jgi:hypothetical protein
VNRDRVLLDFCLAIACASMLLPGCHHEQRITRTSSALRLRAAVEEPATLALSCHGGAFCREDLLASPGSETLAEHTADCTRLGGTLSRSTCPRAHVVASCGASTESGSAIVFTYTQDDTKKQSEDVETLSDLCEAMGGELTR